DVVRAVDVAALGLANLTPAVLSALDSGAFVVLTPRAVRIRHPPLRSTPAHRHGTVYRRHRYS
ncbi:MAG: hypothetical protein ACRDUV_16425, partial [Pseudonocardiaceae bacterium]